MANSDGDDPLRHLSLCEALDRILHKGAVVVGDVRLSVADVDLLYVGLRLVVSSIDALQDPAPESAGGLDKPEHRVSIGLGLGASAAPDGAARPGGDGTATDGPRNWN